MISFVLDPMPTLPVGGDAGLVLVVEDVALLAQVGGGPVGDGDGVAGSVSACVLLEGDLFGPVVASVSELVDVGVACSVSLGATPAFSVSWLLGVGCSSGCSVGVVLVSGWVLAGAAMAATSSGCCSVRRCRSSAR